MTAVLPHAFSPIVRKDGVAEQTMMAWMQSITDFAAMSMGGGGSSDHGALTGLADDDHTQYHNNTRGDTRYYTKTLLDAGQLNSLYYTEAEVDTLLIGKANSSHAHTASQVTDFSEAVDDRVNALLVEGTNISLTYNDGSNTLTIDAAGGSLTETEIDFGSTPIRSKKFTVIDGSVTGSSKISVVPSGNVGTGRVGDDWEWDSIAFAAKAAAGSFTITAFASGRIMGNRKVYYSVG